MDQVEGPTEVMIVSASVGKHLALAPVAFAVTEWPAHTLLYANALFRSLQAAGLVHIGGPAEGDLTPVLNEASGSGETVRDVMLEPPAGEPAKWSCTVWPVADSPNAAKRLVIEVRDVVLVASTKERQRAIAEQLLLGALREHDAAEDATQASERSQHLAAASHDLSLSLDERTTRDTVRRLTLPRSGTWCIVDVVESNGAMHRLSVIHPDPAKQALARLLEEEWPSRLGEPAEPGPALRVEQPTVVSADSGSALVLAAHGEANLRILREIGFGSLLVVPLIVRARVLVGG